MTTNHSNVQRRRQAEEMFPIIERYLECGLTQEEFCQQKNMPLYVFHYWLKKYKREQGSAPKPSPLSQGRAAGAPAFLPIQLTGTEPSSGAKAISLRQAQDTATGRETGTEIVLPTGIVVRFGHTLEPEHLARYIAAIAG